LDQEIEASLAVCIITSYLYIMTGGYFSWAILSFE